MVEEKKSKFKEYKYSFGVGFGSLVIFIVLASTLGQSLYKNLSESTRELKEKRAVKEKLEVKLENLKDLKKNEEKIKKDAEKVTSAMPSHKDISRLFVEFESIASKNGLMIKSVTEAVASTTTDPAANQGASVAGVQNISYTLTGDATSYSSVKNALSELSSALRILSVSKVDASKSGESNVNVVLTVSTYVRSE